MNSLFSIGEVAKMKEVTVKALRYYHKVGILIPRYIDETSGYRYYSIDQFIHLDVIKGCRALGTSIEELQQIFKTCETDELVSFLQEKKQEAQKTIMQMQAVMLDIDRLTDAVNSSKSLLFNHEIKVEYFEERPIIKTNCEEVGNLKELVSYSQLDQIRQERNLIQSLNRGIVYSFQLNHKGDPQFVFSEIESRNEGESWQDYLPAGQYVTLAYHKENEAKRVAQMMAYVKENQLPVKFVVEYDLYHDFFNSDTYGCHMQLFIG